MCWSSSSTVLRPTTTSALSRPPSRPGASQRCASARRRSGSRRAAPPVRRGTAHWFACDGWETCRTLDVSTKTGRPSLTEVVIPHFPYEFDLYNTPWLGVAMDGALSLFHLHSGCHSLHVWTRRGGTEDWFHSKEIKLRPPPEQKAICEDVTCLCADEGSRMLLVMDSLDRVYVVDLETGEVDEVTEQFQRLEPQTVVPLEMDWPTFFLSRLRGAQR
ncbi:hypothetical protein D1007_59632 [Hordeum vulgare]|nr:hypothetical protein D1007_59632 [Hordeum vulgare]